MALFTSDQLRQRARTEVKRFNFGSLTESEYRTKAWTSLQNKFQSQKSPSAKTYDIFLSHSSKDAELVEGLKLELEDKKFSVYVDWIEDPQLDRNTVNKQ